MKTLLLAAVLVAAWSASMPAQDELDELLKKQDVPTPSSTIIPSAVATPSQTPNASVAGEKWKQYVNARFGFSLDYPSELLASTAPTNGSGCEYHTADGRFSLVARAQYLAVADPNDSLDARWRAELRSRGETVTYKHKSESWYVVSGTEKDGSEYYHKFFVQGGNWSDFAATYPHAEAQKYDGWINEISKRFTPFLDGSFDRVKR